MKKIFFMLLFSSAMYAHAQVVNATLQASGLTCSMCSNAINKSLRTLDFVDKVTANIKNSTFEITFKPNTQVDFDKLKNKVEDAGFFVAGLTAVFNFNKVNISSDSHVQQNGALFHFLNTPTQTLDGNTSIKLLDKGFVSAKTFKQNNKLTSMKCYTTGKAEACCTKEGVKEGTRIYHVTI